MGKIDKIIEILQNADQDLVWLDSKICPVKSLFKPRRKTLKNLIKKTRQLQIACKQLEDMGIVEYSMGFISLMVKGGIYVPTSVVLTEEFYKKCAGKRDENGQLNLF